MIDKPVNDALTAIVRHVVEQSIEATPTIAVSYDAAMFACEISLTVNERTAKIDAAVPHGAGAESITEHVGAVAAALARRWIAAEYVDALDARQLYKLHGIEGHVWVWSLWGGGVGLKLTVDEALVLADMFEANGAKRWAGFLRAAADVEGTDSERDGYAAMLRAYGLTPN